VLAAGVWDARASTIIYTQNVEIVAFELSKRSSKSRAASFYSDADTLPSNGPILSRPKRVVKSEMTSLGTRLDKKRER
jgi:hypothetical protein